MDLLRAEIERKRKLVDLAKSSSDVGKVTDNSSDKHKKSKKQYLRSVDLRRFQEDHEEDRDEKLRSSKKSTSVDRTNSSRHTRDLDDSLPDSKGDSKSEQSGLGNSSQDPALSSGSTPATTSDKTAQVAAAGVDPSAKSHKTSTTKQLPPDEITKMLRAFGLPVRLFGERTILVKKANEKKKRAAKYDDTQRWLRLKEARELSIQSRTDGMQDEFRLGSGHGINNPFLMKNSVEEEERNTQEISKPPSSSSTDQKSHPNNSGASGTSSSKDVRNSADLTTEHLNEEGEDDDIDDPHKRIHRFFKGLLKQWEADLAARPDSVRRTAQGKNETKTLKQCKDYIRPLFKLCKTRRLEEGLMTNIFKIVDLCEKGEFVDAHSTYMDVAIGRAAWPIGVTMVGIHARSGRAKIESSNVAHVMNSELQRKYLTSVKRLMSFYQKKRADVAPSKKVA